MNLTETTHALALVQAFDQRTVGEADVIAWQSVLADLDRDDVEAAVKRHYAEQTDRIMPAHIRRLVAQIELERRRAEAKWAPGQYGIPKDEPMPELIGRIREEDVPSDVLGFVQRMKATLPEGDRAKLFPRQTYWEREQRAYLRSHSGARNPLYRPGTPCGVPSPHPGHEWQIEGDKFWCRGVDG